MGKRRRREPKQTYEMILADIRALQRVNNRLVNLREHGKEIDLTKLTILFGSGTDFDKFCNFLSWMCFPHTVKQFVHHPKYPLYVNGVHLIILSHYIDGMTVCFELIFNPVTGFHMCNHLSFVEDV